MKKLCRLLILFFAFQTVNAQVTADSLELLYSFNDISFLSNRFEKQLNTYSLNSILNYNYDRQIQINVYENYKSNLIKQTGKNIRDEHFFYLSGSYPLNEYLRVGLRAGNNILSDNRKIAINHSTISDGIVFLNITPVNKLQLIPFAGIMNNKQIGKNDNGVVFGFEGNSENFSSSEFIINTAIKYRNENILPRHNIISDISFLLKNQFSTDITNEITAKYSQNKKDFYYDADSLTSAYFNIQENLQSRTETDYLIQNRLRYNKFFSIFDMELTGRYYFRDIDRDTRYKLLQQANSSLFDTKINELNLNFEGSLSYTSDFFVSNLKITYGERDEKNLTKRINSVNENLYLERSKLESGKNNTGIRTSVALTGDIIFNQNNRLNFSLFQNKLVYNTPSTDNYDDRDELLSMVRLKYISKLSPYFEAYATLEGTFNHIIYIYSQKSSNNNINRIIKLSSGGNYVTKNISSLNIFEVSANYTVYDFEDIVSGIRSLSFRQFFYSDSTVLAINKNLDFLINGYLKLSEQGDLKWKAFTTKPFRYLEEIYCEPKLKIKMNELSIYPGVRFFSLKTYKYLSDNSKKEDTRYYSRGPVLNITYSLKSSLFLGTNMLYEFIESENGIKKDQASINFQINWIF